MFEAFRFAVETSPPRTVSGSRTLSYPARNSVFIGLVSRAELQPRKKPRTPPKSIQRPKCWGCRAPYQTGRTMKERTSDEPERQRNPGQIIGHSAGGAH